MSDKQSANNLPIVSRNCARAKIGEALRLYVGRGRRYTVKQLSNGTGVPDRLIECAVVDPDSPDFRPLALEALLSISRFLGAAFTTEWLKLADQGAFDLPDAELPPGTLAADTVDDAAIITRAAADGKFDDAEKPVLRIVGHRMIERGQKLATA